ncbi:hypothetical protein E5345_00875 [Propionibacterium sp. NM47_B9-13]|uniref:ABC transmembrane type-1 domain-containing protein n=1 Tax=Cutibacterium modestum HL044PA1 TaxID=765109 RepID=A0ABP2K980_9ACTN|nr:hypothetical protein HMPREF9621_01908 [Cutibacterium modestum HL037PA2]EFS93467.1 hypothetical protein HMPREF9607_00387 [Cutibacterium modestum HL044PA1]EFT14686.1 hypothetical protein HMPREF9622_02256 [Cutibacterium modestum HL037PA3]REB73474.1 hypothetical protein CP877_07755 [Cutibacterium modestum]TGY29877.1 hypothetical protein E5345_00875 [Propionibacterium sp. NM47_B9-13]
MGVPRRKLALSLRVITLLISVSTATASLVVGELLVMAIRPLLADKSDSPLLAHCHLSHCLRLAPLPAWLRPF